MKSGDAGIPLASGLPRPKRRRRRFILLLFLLAVVGFVVWVSTSKGPAAQVIQELAGWKQDQTILATPFTVGPHTFRYYKFSVPPGSTNMAVVGEFSVVAKNPNSSILTAQGENGQQSLSADNNADHNVEVYILAEAAFMMWQHGTAASSLYDSGSTPAGVVRANLPAGAGTYYLVFDNKASPKTAKTVPATVRLRHKNWFRRMLTR